MKRTHCAEPGAFLGDDLTIRSIGDARADLTGSADRRARCADVSLIRFSKL